MARAPIARPQLQVGRRVADHDDVAPVDDRARAPRARAAARRREARRASRGPSRTRRSKTVGIDAGRAQLGARARVEIAREAVRASTSSRASSASSSSHTPGHHADVARRRRAALLADSRRSARTAATCRASMCRRHDPRCASALARSADRSCRRSDDRPGRCCRTRRSARDESRASPRRR